MNQCTRLDRNKTLRALQVIKEKVEPCLPDNYLPDNYKSLAQKIKVPSLTIDRLLKKHQVAKVDLLVLDTMGFDFEILKLFPFETLKPTIIQLEHNTLSLTDQAACFQFLANQGYSLSRVAVDTSS